MNVIKYYEVCCDICGAYINHYVHYKPSINHLKEDCGKVVISHSKVITICENCNEMDKNTLKQRIIEVATNDIIQDATIKIGNGIVDMIDNVDIIGADEKLTIENIYKNIKGIK